MRSDKMQMSYVPQCTEHVALTAVKGGETKYYDITVPMECIVENMVVVIKTKFDQAGVELDIGSKTTEDLFTPSGAIDLQGATNNTVDTNEVYWTPVSSLPDRVIRLKLSHSGGTDSVGAVYVYANYRFNENIHPTRVTNYA